ncbi:XRE family transcriptional regulator [Candidatus Wolfebacteria bacterium CG03_land_8_20_14_0_80_40_12]|uniref:XRE family transcriptional regulator n=1 Tax=Candidatus Wolfebacteria bacterium CG03_land_8_20_14_0_80_40_12 TaxID=1975069 RepID=A0A2M7B5D4_9BACT|nr:MAG: XRE family transcriptional regulator [Candidatus Wolfebacteria bacterium CG03_land_8_20_14_0_80_40_12]
MATNLYKKIKTLREQNKFSQEYLAKKLELSRPTYMQIEKGERDITVPEARKLAMVFGLSLEDFLGDEVSTISDVVLKKEKAKEKERDIRIVMPSANVKKFKEVLLYVLSKVGAKPNIGETALYKLLYFIDFDFYEKFEEQLTGARYIKNHYGPTPVEFKKIVEIMEEKKEIERVKSSYFQYEQKKYLPRREPDLKSLSAQEIKHIDEVLARLSDKNANELSDYSHNDVPWKVHKSGEIISYESVFYRDPEHSVRNYDDEL